MPSFATAIVLTDGKSTPVNHTFDPSMRDQAIALYQDQSSGIPSGYMRLTFSTKRAADQVAGINKVTVKLYLPTLEVSAPSTATGYQPVAKPAYECQSVITYMLPVRSSLPERTDLAIMTKNLANHATVLDIVKNLTSIF